MPDSLDGLGLVLGDPLLAAGGQIAQVVQFRVEAAADEAAVARRQRAIVDQGRLQLAAQVRAQVQLALPAGSAAGCLRAVSLAFSFGRLRQRAADEAQVARTGPARRDAGQQPLQVVHAPQMLAQLAAQAVSSSINSSTASSRALIAAAIGQRIGQPVGQQPRAHRRDGAVEHGQQRAFAAARRGSSA